MDNKGIVLKGALALVVLGLLVGAVCLGVFTRKAMPVGQTVPLQVFSAPTEVASGESWVLLGSLRDLPTDLAIAPAALGVEVVEVQKVSSKAIGIRLKVGAGIQGQLLKLSSAAAGSEVLADLYLGTPPASLTADASFSDSDFEKGQLVVGGNQFIYGYFPKNGVNLAAVRIHNRATGAWVTHEIALAKARDAVAASQAPATDDPTFKVVDVLETLPDTNGDGIYDFQEAPEVKAPVPEQIGVELASGTNTLDLIAVDEAGNASWRTVEVFTTYVPESQ